MAWLRGKEVFAPDHEFAARVPIGPSEDFWKNALPTGRLHIIISAVG